MGGNKMIALDNLDDEKILEVSQYMGYDPQKPAELSKYKNEINKMDTWDISRILFFGNQYVKNTTDKA
jgi:hypothetical protein